MKNIAQLYIDKEDKESRFEPIKRVRKIWIRRPETKVKDKEHYNRRKEKELYEKQLLENV